MSIASQIELVYERIGRACRRAGRNPEEVQLVAVTKTVDVARIEEAIAAGIEIVGENRVQEAWPKFQVIGNRVRWHMIGHLQTNKVKRALQFAEVIQSVDSVHLAQEIQKQAEKLDRAVEVLIEVNTSGESSKFGFSPESVLEGVQQIASLSRLRVKGLMTIGAFLPDPNDVRPCFQLLRRLRDKIAARGLEGVEMDVLSMGMTDDFEVAIEEGSTMVRIGRLIFGERPQPVTQGV